MIKLALASMVLLASSTAFAADPAAQAPQVLIGESQPLRYTGWYLAPTAGFTSFNSKLAYLPGLRGAVMLNQRFGVGLAGNLIGTNDTFIGDNEVREVGAYGGFYFQYVLRSTDLIHAYADATVGGGSWCERVTNDDECNERDFAFIEPTVNVELNLARNVRLAAGVGYRGAIAERVDGFSRGSMSGVVARTSLVVGVF
jgi:hypothetical protein